MANDIITISGFPKTGTTTVATDVAEQLDALHISGGKIFRAYASEHDMTLPEFSAYVNEHPDIDHEIDNSLDLIIEAFLDDYSEPIQSHDYLPDIDVKTPDVLVLESRLSGWLAGDNATLRTWLYAPLNVRAQRAADSDDTIESTQEDIRSRQEDETMRYREWYDIDITDTSPYELMLNTDQLTIDETSDLIIHATRQRSSL